MLFLVLLEFDKDFFLFSIICHLLGHGALCGVTRGGGWVGNYACVLGGGGGSTSSDTHKLVEIWKEISY